MKSVPPELTFSTAGEPFAQLCIDTTFYWRGSMFDRGAGLAEAYRRALAYVKDTITYFESGTMSGPKKLKADSLDMVPFWLVTGKRREDIFMMTLKGGSSADSASDTGLQFFADEEEEPAMGGLTLTLPVSWAAKPDRLLEMTQTIADAVDFESGHCGFSLAWDPGGDSATDAMSRMLGVANRFLGLDLPKLNTTVSSLQRSAKPGIKTVQWLTFLGTPVIDQLGGETAVKARLATVAKVHITTTGILVQAGEAPTIGDSNRQDDITALKAVGQALASIRVPGHGTIFGTRDQTGEWLARFDH